MVNGEQTISHRLPCECQSRGFFFVFYYINSSIQFSTLTRKSYVLILEQFNIYCDFSLFFKVFTQYMVLRTISITVLCTLYSIHCQTPFNRCQNDFFIAVSFRSSRFSAVSIGSSGFSGSAS